VGGRIAGGGNPRSRAGLPPLTRVDRVVRYRKHRPGAGNNYMWAMDPKRFMSIVVTVPVMAVALFLLVARRDHDLHMWAIGVLSGMVTFWLKPPG
jgi:hypothetical protein